MGNYPTFNPNEYAKYSPQAWINHAVSHTYEPGSTFKIVTAASAFEEGLADRATLSIARWVLLLFLAEGFMTGIRSDCSR